MSRAKRQSAELGSLSQRQLIWLRFRRHALATIGLLVLLALYLVAAAAEFFSPGDPQQRVLQSIYAPPQQIRFDLKDGLHVHALRSYTNPATGQRHYAADSERKLRLQLLAPSAPYRLMGLIPMQRRLLGLRDFQHGDPLPGSEAIATFFPLGADKYGRDLLSRIIHGSRISLSIGIVAIAFTFALGIAIGGISGYASGNIDHLIQRSIEVIKSIPSLPLWIAFAAILPPDWSVLKSYLAITIVLSLIGWTGLARVVRGKILSLREEDYAVAARLLGASHPRILFNHLLPGFASHIIVSITLTVPAMILGETALSFLGLGLRPPVISWGVLLQDCIHFDIVANYPWMLTPVLFIIVTVLAYNFVGDGVRDAADPYAGR